jgi:hypothetical protein
MRSSAANGMGIMTSMSARSIKQVRHLVKKVILFSFRFFINLMSNMSTAFRYSTQCRTLRIMDQRGSFFSAPRPSIQWS